MRWFPAVLCLAGLSSAFSRIVPCVQKVFLFFLIPSSRNGLFAKKNAAECCFLKHSRFAWQYLVLPGTVILVSRTRNSFYPVDFQKHTECILLSWLLSFLYTWNLKYIILEENLWQFLIALSFLSKSFFMHRRRRITYDQISAVNGLMRYMILKLHGNETRCSCNQRLPESDF